jgi:peptidoglycan/xylan/chitin deacetylase (PgdA/CDA1 family)
MKIVGFSVDVDGWDTCLDFYGIKVPPEKADEEVNSGVGIRRLVSLFRKNSVKGTFFIVGNTAKRFKKEVRSISKAGHEIGCHSMTHSNLADKSILHIKREISDNIKTVGRITRRRKKDFVGFRAPAFGVSNTLLDALEETGFEYDSSINPTYIPGEYGVPFAPLSPYRPSKTSVRKRGDRNFIELPVAVNPIVPIPLGAAFIRNFGSWWAKLGIKMLWSLGAPAIIYMHPKDVVEVPSSSRVPWYLKRNSGEECLRRMDDIIKFCKRERAKILTLEEIADVYSKKI